MVILSQFNEYGVKDAEDVENPLAVKEIAVVAASAMKDNMINLKDVESYDLKRHLVRHSNDKESDENNEGVDQGLAVLATSEQLLPVPDPTLDVRPPHVVDSSPDASIGAALASTLGVDKFYNASKKVPHPDVIVPKKESSWWINRKMCMKRKTQEMAKVELELQKMREDAAQLAKLNANL